MTSRAILDQKLEAVFTPELAEILKNKKTITVAGTTAATNIAVADEESNDIKTSAIILACYRADGTVGNYLDEASVTSAGNIQLATTETTGFVLAVEYLDI